MSAPRRTLLSSVLALIAMSSGAQTASAASASSLVRESEAALRRLYTMQPRAKLLGARARAILVFPRIVKVGVLLAGGQTGEGVLFVKNRPAGYFNLSAASFGPQAGGQTFSYALFFTNDAALAYLQKSEGWAVGTGPSVVVVEAGAAASLNSMTLTHDVYAIPFGQAGLMADIGIEGSKIAPIKPGS